MDFDISEIATPVLGGPKDYENRKKDPNTGPTRPENPSSQHGSFLKSWA